MLPGDMGTLKTQIRKIPREWTISCCCKHGSIVVHTESSFRLPPQQPATSVWDMLINSIPKLSTSWLEYSSLLPQRCAPWLEIRDLLLWVPNDAARLEPPIRSATTAGVAVFDPEGVHKRYVGPLTIGGWCSLECSTLLVTLIVGEPSISLNLDKGWYSEPLSGLHFYVYEG